MTGVFIPSQPSMRTVGNFQCQSTNRLQKGVDGCQFSARTPSQTKRKNRNHYQPSRQPSYARGYAYTSAESGTGKWYIAVHFRVSIDRARLFIPGTKDQVRVLEPHNHKYEAPATGARERDRFWLLVLHPSTIQVVPSYIRMATG